MLELNVWTVRYFPTEDGDRDVTSENHAVEQFESVDDVAAWLHDQDITELSSYPNFQRHGWFSREPYTHPYTGEVEEVTAHRGAGIENSGWWAVWAQLTGDNAV